MRTKIVVSRKWSKPQIEAFVSQEEVGASIDLDEFIAAVVEEIGNPTTLVTKAGLKSKLEIAAEAVLSELRHSTKFVL